MALAPDDAYLETKEGPDDFALCWVPGTELIAGLGATVYYVQPKGFYASGRPRGLAVYKHGERVLSERDAVEVFDSTNRAVWLVRREATPIVVAEPEELGLREALAMPRD